MIDWAMEKARDLARVGCGCDDADEAEFSCEHFNVTCQKQETAIATALREAEARGRASMKEEAARLARITHPKDADFSGVWGEYEHGCDDTQGVIYEAIRALP